MRATGQIEVRHFDALSANFTLPIRRKSRPLCLSLYPFSLKKLTGDGWKYEDEHLRRDECKRDEIGAY